MAQRRHPRLPREGDGERADVAPVFYACSQSFTKYVIDRVGVRAVVAAFPRIPGGTWLTDLEAAARTSLEALRNAWLEALGRRG